MTKEQEDLLITKVNDIHEVVIGTPTEPEKSLVWKVLQNTSFRKSTNKVLWAMMLIIIGLTVRTIWAVVMR